MKKFTIIIMFAMLGISTVDAQCVNANFSTGNFTNWTGSTGQNNGGGTFTSYDSTYGMIIGTPNSPPSDSGQQTIMNLPGTDPNTANVLNVLPPIGTVSCRIGNEQVESCDGAPYPQAARLSYVISVDSSDYIFTYQYAVVLQDPYGSGHTLAQRPKFIIRALDSTGVGIDSIIPSCSISCAPETGACDNTVNVVWKNWTIDYFDLSSYIGHNVTIDFTAYDCSLGGHFGYAYISCYCGSTITIGINEMELSNKIKIYPNPTNDNITIEIGDLRFTDLDLKINDIVGNTVLENTLYNKVSTIDVSSLAKGMYFLKIKSAKGVESRKFIKL